MSNFQTQLASIMETLAKSAVAEISKLFDDSALVIRLQMSRSEREIETLKRELQSLESELRAAQGCGKTRAISRSVAVQVFDESGCKSGDVRATSPEGLSGKRWRVGPPTCLEKEDDSLQCVNVRDKCAGTELNRPESSFIKEERHEEGIWNHDLQEELKTREGGADVGDEERPPFESQLFEEKCDALAEDWGEHNSKLTHTQGQEQLQSDDSVVMAVQGNACANQQLVQLGYEHGRGGPCHLGSKNKNCKKASRSGIRFTQWDCDVVASDPERHLQGISGHAELQPGHARAGGSTTTLSTLGPFNVKSPAHTLNIESVEVEETRSEFLCSQQSPYRERLLHSLKEGGLLSQPRQLHHEPLEDQVRLSERSARSDAQGRGGYSSSLKLTKWRNQRRIKGPKVKPGEKQFSCSHCGKSFDHCSQLEIHRRSHTGEKPYGCIQCGKRFSLRCNLITHQRIHTGEKPYGCAYCGMSFAQQSSLTTHQRVHTGERPFICALCGKCFAQAGSLKTHQRVHSRNTLI